MYSIVNWDTDEVIARWGKLSVAKKLCRKQGHTGDGHGSYYSPVARVQDNRGHCVYNPRFIIGRHNHLKAETFVIAARDNDDEEWEKLDTRGSLNAAIKLANNTVSPIVAIFDAATWDLEPPKPKYLRDNRNKEEWPIRSGQYLIDSAGSDCF